MLRYAATLGFVRVAPLPASSADESGEECGAGVCVDQTTPQKIQIGVSSELHATVATITP